MIRLLLALFAISSCANIPISYQDLPETFYRAAFGYPELNLSEIEKPIRDSTASAIFNYQDKYLRDGGLEESSRELPAQLNKKEKNEILSLTKKLIELIGIRGVFRVDFLKREDEIYINEVNSIPGSLSTYLWKNTNLTKLSIIDSIVQEALESSKNKWDSTGSDGAALIKAKDIGSKLG